MLLNEKLSKRRIQLESEADKIIINSEQYEPEEQRNRLVYLINMHRKRISDRNISLEKARDMQLKLNRKLKSDLSTGCHSSQPLKSLRVEIEGKMTQFKINEELPDNKVKVWDSDVDCKNLYIKLGPDLILSKNL